MPEDPHFSTRSRRYSTTLGSLRRARQDWQDRRTLEAHRLDPDTPVVRARAEETGHLNGDDDVVLVVGDWRYIGCGHSPGQAVYADTIRQDLVESRRIARQHRNDDQEAAP
jgi:hypothetical protein